MKQKFNIWYTGLWIYPIFVIVFYFTLKMLIDDYKIDITDQVSFLIVMVVPFIFPLLIWSANKNRADYGDTEFSFATTFGTKDGRSMTKAKREATYPKIASKYLSQVPQGLVLGKHQGKYVSVPVHKDGHSGIVVASPGSGKSILLKAMLLADFYSDKYIKNDKLRNSDLYNAFIVDIKPEIYPDTAYIYKDKCMCGENREMYVIEPENRVFSAGFDVFYRIHREGCSTTQKLKAIQDIADCLIEDADNPFFSDNAKKLFIGITYFYVEKGWDFIPIIQKMNRTKLQELLKEICEEAEQEGMSIVLDKLAAFNGKDGNEALDDIQSTMLTALSELGSYPDLVYMFKDNPNRISPAVLDNPNCSLDLAISEGMLSTYKQAFRLITCLCLKHVESEFKPDGSHRTVFFIDEASRIGKIPDIANFLSTARGKGCSVMMFFQSISQFYNLYKKDLADSILNICELKIFLSANEKQAVEVISNAAGEYDEEKMSYGKATVGKKDVKYNVEHRKAVDGEAVSDLRDKQELVAILFGKYYRFKALRYFKDSYLKPIADDIKEFNKNNKG